MLRRRRRSRSGAAGAPGDAGEALANAAARYVFHDRLRPPGERQNPSGIEPLGSTAPAKLKAAIMLMEARLEEATTIAEVAEGVGSRSASWSGCSRIMSG